MHYSKEYYNEFIKELDKQILQDILNHIEQKMLVVVRLKENKTLTLFLKLKPYDLSYSHKEIKDYIKSYTPFQEEDIISLYLINSYSGCYV